MLANGLSTRFSGCTMKIAAKPKLLPVTTHSQTSYMFSNVAVVGFSLVVHRPSRGRLPPVAHRHGGLSQPQQAEQGSSIFCVCASAVARHLLRFFFFFTPIPTLLLYCVSLSVFNIRKCQNPDLGHLKMAVFGFVKDVRSSSKLVPNQGSPLCYVTTMVPAQHA